MPSSRNIRLLFICSANLCRSPLAAALLRARFEERGIEVEVTSAGVLAAGDQPPDGLVDALGDWGVSLAGTSAAR